MAVQQSARAGRQSLGVGVRRQRARRVKAGAIGARADAQEVDYVIIGAGMAGAAAARYLSADAPNAKIAVIEQRSVAHDRGSSYGDSRMYREMYDSKYYSQMQSKTLPMWDQLEKDSGEKLRYDWGLLFYGETDTGETVEGSIPGAAETCKELGIPHDYYYKHQLEESFPLYAGDNYEGVFEKAAGSVNSSRACKAMGRLAMQNGVELIEGESVTSLSVPQRNDVRVATDSGRNISAKRAIVAAGPWTNDVLENLGKSFSLEIHNVHWTHYKIDPAYKGHYPQFFCFRKPEQWGEWDGGLYYGFPPESVESHPDGPMIKVGIDFTPDDPKFKTPSMANFTFEPDPTVVNLIDHFLRTHWKGVQERVEAVSSPYTMTDDQNFLLDRIPGAEEVICFSGGSGRAFKFAPLLGQCIADLTLDRQPSWDISPFSASRSAAGFKSSTA